MAGLPGQARVVVIGGGAVGASCLYHLARAGWTDALLLEQSELTAGSTWHAAGNVPTFSSTWSIMHMQRYSAALYRGLGQAVDYPMNYHVTGSVRLGHTAERMREFARVVGMGRHQGMELELLGPAEIADRYPFVALHDLRGALYDPCDGDIDPAQLTQALARGARALGARIERFCRVTGLARDRDGWLVATPKGTVRAEIVVNAAGYQAGRVAAMMGRRLPMAVMSHQYLVFDTIPELAAWSAAAGRKLPLLRDVDSSYYLRQEKMGFNLGPYENPGRAHWATDDDPMPEDFSFQLFPDDLDRIAWWIEDAAARVPLLAGARLQKVINGPIPYTPDGNPLIGPVPGQPGAFEACVFTFGICQAGGAGKVLAEWVTEGATEWDMWSCDPRRFTGFEDPGYCLAKAREVYGNEYAIHFPHHAWPAGRDVRQGPLHDRVAALGAQFGPANGWERANWYARPGDDTAEAAQRSFAREGPWYGAVREECLAVRDAAGILDLPGFSRFRLQGPGARAWLQTMIAGRVPAPGRIGLGYFADDRGRIVTEMSVMALDADDFILVTAAVAQGHDLDWLARHLPPAAAFDLSDVSEAWSCLILTGPMSRHILAPLTGADLARPWLSHQPAAVAGRPCRLVRVSFAGELGWEIHARPDDCAPIWDALRAVGAPHGLRPFGMFALNALRIEKGYRAWKVDLSTDYTLLQAGLDRFIAWDKPDFLGRAALIAERARAPGRRFATLAVAPGDADPPAMSTLWHQGEVVGEATSAAFGHRTGTCIALAILRADLARPGTALEVEVFGDRRPARVAPHPALWDPANERLRA